MPEMSRSTKKEFQVVSQRDQGFRVATNLASGSQVPEILSIVAWLPRLGSITPLEMDISYGLSDGATDNELIEFFLALVDVDNIPDGAALRSHAIWQRVQSWQVASAVGVNQMMSYDVIDWFTPPTYTYTEVAGFTRRTALCILALSNQTSSVLVQGRLNWVETMTQRVWSDSGVEGELTVEAEESADF